MITVKRLLPFILLVLLGTACAQNKQTPTPVPVYYSIATKVIPEGAGTIEVSVSDGAVLEGTQVTFTARPAEGYAFSAWGGTASSWKTNPKKITMHEDLNVLATFEPAAVTPPTEEE